MGPVNPVRASGAGVTAQNGSLSVSRTGRPAASFTATGTPCGSREGLPVGTPCPSTSGMIGVASTVTSSEWVCPAPMRNVPCAKNDAPGGMRPCQVPCDTKSYEAGPPNALRSAVHADTCGP